jgi:hypothetical protein
MDNGLVGAFSSVHSRNVPYALMGTNPKPNRKVNMRHWIFLILAIFGAYFIWMKFVAKKI